MITTEFSNPSPHLLAVMACKLDVCPVTDVESNSLCDCTCRDCYTRLDVFAKSGGTERQNDKSSFLFRVLTASDSGQMKLMKVNYTGADTEIAVLNNNTYGTYYDFGTWTTYTGQDLYTGYLLEWELVLNGHGFGEYYVQADLTISGSSVTVYSDIYYLREFTEQRADQTVKIETYQNGNIERSQFDYTGMNWYQSIRIPGILWQKTPVLEEDHYLTPARTRSQIQSQVIMKYTLETYLIPASVWSMITENKVMANEIYVSDYNTCNAEEYSRIPLDVEEIPDSQDYQLNKNRTLVITFTERSENRLKRNFK